MGTAASLFKLARLTPQGSVRWGEPIPSRRPGVYAVEAPSPSISAPFSLPAIEAWIQRVPGIRVDGAPADARALRKRLDEFWIPSETVVYIGRAGTDLGGRVRAYYRTPLGDPRPHAGGHWLKTLSTLDQFRVWWTETDDPVDAERSLLRAFAEQHAVGFLPFANRQDADGDRKDHGITLSTLPRSPGRADIGASGVVRARRLPPARTGSISEINAALQRLACADPRREVTAVEAAAELDRLGLLRDSADRPGLPLRRLLREGRFEHTRQDGDRWWFIECANR
jgi:hypothetical protein